MALYVNTNISSKNAQRMLANSTNSLDTSYKRLASGLRINSAKDDAAGLQISNRLTSQINGLEQGNRNAQDGISFAQTAEGAMDEMTTMFQRIRTLALQSANGTNSAKDRKALQEEVVQLCSEIDRIAKDTTFGGENILNGEAVANNNLTYTAATAADKGTKSISFQVGADANQTIGIKLSMTGSAGTGGADPTEAQIAESQVGFNMNGFTAALQKQIKIEGGVNAANTKLIAANDIAAAGTDGNKTGFIKSGDSITFDISTAEGAQNVLANIDLYIAAVDSKRAELGAVQNRLESTIRNQSNVAENVSDARSRIRDTDFATETANMTQTSIIQQASQSILSQANQRPQLALSLLG
jgi:flagellin